MMVCCTAVGKLAPVYEAVITTGTTLESHCVTSEMPFACPQMPGHYGFQDTVGVKVDLLLVMPLKVALSC